MDFEKVDAQVAGVPFMSSAQGRKVYDHIVKHGLARILELGFAHGKSTCYLAAAADEVGGAAHVTTIDRSSAHRREPNILQMLATCGLESRVTPMFAETSYTWELLRLLDRKAPPRFDFVYIDGGHTWDVTGFAFFLVDRMLAPGGWLLFDDLDWTIADSRGLQEAAWAAKLPEVQRRTAQVRKVYELLVRTHPGYADFHDEDGWGWARKW